MSFFFQIQGFLLSIIYELQTRFSSVKTFESGLKMTNPLHLQIVLKWSHRKK